MRACGSISAILTAPGNAAPTRTLTDCCASTFPKGPISAFTAPTKLQPWPPPSTRGPERRLIGRRPQRRLTGFSYQPTKTALRRPLESALHTAIAVVDEAAAPNRQSLMQSLLQRVEHEVGVSRAGDTPADDAPREGVDDEGDVDEAGPGRDVGEVGHP